MSIPSEAVTGIVFDIQRFSIHDGPGIRTTVFLKGCPLRCVWCHNPESYEKVPELFYDAKKCIGCESCGKVCARGCHRITDGLHVLERAACCRCGACADACPADALTLCGKTMSVGQVLAKVLADQAFYRESGGMTLSGGEPMAQPEFALALLKKAKEAGLSTCMETSGFCSRENLRKVLPFTDLFLYDCKETDPERHKLFTGVSPQRIAENLEWLDAQGANIILRCPLIPGYNAREAHLLGIAALANRLPHVLEVQLEPYHNLGAFKAGRLGRENPAAIHPPTTEQIEEWLSFLGSCVSCPVKRA